MYYAFEFSCAWLLFYVVFIILSPWHPQFSISWVPSSPVMILRYILRLFPFGLHFPTCNFWLLFISHKYYARELHLELKSMDCCNSCISTDDVFLNLLILSHPMLPLFLMWNSWRWSHEEHHLLSQNSNTLHQTTTLTLKIWCCSVSMFVFIVFVLLPVSSRNVWSVIGLVVQEMKVFLLVQ